MAQCSALVPTPIWDVVTARRFHARSAMTEIQMRFEAQGTLVRSKTYRYSIVVKDDETGETVVRVEADWTKEQRQIAMAVLSRLTSRPAGASNKPKPR